MKTIIRNAELVNPNQRIGIFDVVLEGDKIIGVYEHYQNTIPADRTIDADGKYLCPGFIEVHFHGAMGVDTMDTAPTSFQALSRYCAEHGVTSFYPTTWAAPPKALTEVLTTVKHLARPLPGAQIMGVHLEGPYLVSNFRGAQDEKMLALPLAEDYQAWFETGVVRLVTCAPELPGATDFIAAALKRDIQVSIGHSGATFVEVKKAANLGVTQATHLFNGMGGIHHREPGTAGGILDDSRIYVQVICDGIHLHPAIVRLIYSLKTNERTMLITDSIVGAGLSDGTFENNGNELVISNGIARTRDGGLAGSTLTMERAISNMMAFTGEPLEKVITMATSTPAEGMGIADRKGRIEKGFDADLVLMDKDLSIARTFVMGKSVYSRL